MEQQENKKQRVHKNKMTKGNGKGLFLLHILQLVSFVAAAVLLVLVFLGAYVVVDTRNGTKSYHLSGEDEHSSFEDSGIFNNMLGSSVSDIICYGAIRGQMESNAKFDPKKEIDVTAFADRYDGIATEYITAKYYLDDLIKWAQTGFQYEETYMTSEKAGRFLNGSSLVTRVDLEDYNGRTISHINTDLSKVTRVTEDVSGNYMGAAGDRWVTVLNNRYRSVDGKNVEDYVSGWDEYHTLCSKLEKAAADLKTNYNEYLSYKEYYDADHTNVVYFIRRKTGNDLQIFTNMDTSEKTVSGLKGALKEQCGRYIYYDPQNMQYETNTMIREETVRYILNGYEYAYPEDTQIMIGVNTLYPVQDQFGQGKEGFQNYVPYVWRYLAGALFCMVVFLILLVVITLREGTVKRKDTGETYLRLRWQDHIPTEVMILGVAVFGLGIFYGAHALPSVWRKIEVDSLLLLCGIAALLIYLCFSFFYYSFVRRFKAGSIFKESLLNRFCRFLKKCVVYFYDHTSVILRVWVPFILFVLLHMGMMALTRRFSPIYILILLILADGAVGYLLYRSALARQRILKGIELIRKGDLGHKINEEGMYGEDLLLARAVNSIGDSVKEAVETSMKDERLKADLITNVSHDLKTPLTSIINYVDLIKREDVQNDRVNEYIKILDAKSQRLKQLTDDLVEASKISSGNIVLQWEKINLVELLNQTIGEFSERFEQKALYPVFKAPAGSVYIEADSRRIWRVIENLFNNIVKYALEGTRVYIDMEFLGTEDAGRQVMLSVKNISAQPLKVDPAELTERFIRGDESRTTEGSGLGLSIAKNLTEVQKGRFEIVMDGDLFKVNMYFPLLKE